MEKLRKLFETNKKEKLTAVIFVITIFVMLFGMLFNWKSVGRNFLSTYRTNIPTGAPYLERITGAIDAAETAVNDGTFERQQFIEMYGLMQLAMDKKIIPDYNYGSLYKTRHGQTTFAVPDRYINDAANSLFLLANEILTANMKFMYVQFPFKIPPDEFCREPELPFYITDNANQNADAFLEMLQNANIDIYDLRKDFWQSGYTQNELFFNTDHHWTIRGAFLATDLLANKLNSDYGFEIEKNLYTDVNFNFTVYDDFFLGSMGRRVGRIYGGLDDFTLITPAFETNITLTQVEGLNETVFEGSFDKSVLEMSYIDNPDVSSNRYAVYHGDYPELRFINNKVKNNNKVLIVKDSFGIPVYSFLSLGVKEVRAIDMRLFKMNVAEYAKEYNPDVVIVMYNADSFLDPMFTFNLDVDNEEHIKALQALN